MRTSKTPLWRVATLALMVAIFALSSRPSPSLGGDAVQNISTDVAHVLIYGTLAGLVLKSLPGVSRAGVIAMLAAIAYGVSDELHQSLVPGREASLLDLGFDIIGAVLGVNAASAVSSWWERRRREAR